MIAILSLPKWAMADSSLATTNYGGGPFTWLTYLCLGIGGVLSSRVIQTDQDLLRRVCRSADQSALLTLLHRHRGFIQSLVYRFGHGGIDLEDLQHDLFLLLMDRLPGTEPPYRFKAWLSTLLRNRLIDAHRHQKTQQRYEDWAAQQASGYETTCDQQLDQRLLLAQVMTHLSEREQAVLSRFYLQGKSYQAIADELGYSFKQVTGVMYRAMKRLRSKMSEHRGYFTQ